MIQDVPDEAHATSSVEQAYQDRIHRMTVAERVARSAAMLQWMREQLTRQIIRERGPTDPDTLKWLVALRLYGDEPQVRQWIEQKLADVSR